VDENRYLSKVGQSFQTTTKFSAAHQWHLPVSDNDVGYAQLDGVERLGTVVGASHIVSFIDQYEAPRSEDFGLVVDEQN
jgi:hypothetical protein